jgi:hypothetical protein
MPPPDPRITQTGGGRLQVADGVYRLTPGVCNFYLLEDGGKLVLVDAGAPATGTSWSAPWPRSAAGWRTWRRC